MRVVHISFRYGLKNTGGAAIAATRLHQALLRAGCDSYFVCIHNEEPGDVNVYQMPEGWRRRLYFVVAKLTRCIWHFTPYRRSYPLLVTPIYGLGKLLREIKPDVIHFHWMNGDVCSLEWLQKLPYKMVVNLHDLFMINAFNPHQRSVADLRFCNGFKRENSLLIERWMFRRKIKFAQRKVAAFIGPSSWAVNCCRNSIVGRGVSAYVIPNLIHPDFFTYEGRRSKNKKFVILFGCWGGRDNNLKGFDDLLPALHLLSNEVKDCCELRIFGERGEDALTEGIQTTFLGPLMGADMSIRAYDSADLFVFPSKQETQGMTKIEALLCGTPVVAFNRTACADDIEHAQNGWIAADGDFVQFANGINYFYQKWERELQDRTRSAIRMVAREKFSERAILQRILEVYGGEALK